MNPEITHERCSELLRPYVRRELDDADVAALERHLASCDECRQELSGLRALLDYDYAGLTGTELVRLERSIAAEARADRDREVTVTPLEPRAEPRRSLAGMALGIAAALLVVAVAIGSVLTGGSGDGEGDTAATGGREPQSGESGAGGAGNVSGPRPVFGTSGLATANAFTTAEDAQADQATKLRRVSESSLEQLGSGRLFQRFAAAYDTEDAPVLQDRFISELAADAGSDAGTVTLCARNTIEASTGPALPVLGSFARFDDRPVLVLGFIYTDQTEGPLTRYSLWVWPRGSCDAPLRTASGEVD